MLEVVKALLRLDARDTGNHAVVYLTPYRGKIRQSVQASSDVLLVIY
jgi:hypothetical protein